MIGNNSETIQAYTEINCLLKKFPKEYINKIPDKLLNMIKEKSDEKYNITIDTRKSLKDQNITKKTKNILVVLKYNYWSNESEKEYYKKVLQENEEKYQKELAQKYNTDNLFKDKIIKKEIKESEYIENTDIIEYKESFFNKLLKKLKSFFSK